MLKRLLCLYFYVIPTFGVTSFTISPYHPGAIPLRPSSARTTDTTLLYLASDNGSNSNDNKQVETTNINQEEQDNYDNTQEVTLFERARILSYRIAIGASALCLSVQAIDDVGFLEGTGANIDQFAEQSTMTLPLVAGATLLFCIVPRNQILAEVGTLALGLATVGSGLVVLATGGQEGGVVISWSLSMLSLMAVNLREIWYFGFRYKQECAIALFTLPFMLDHNNSIPFTIPLCALGWQSWLPERYSNHVEKISYVPTASSWPSETYTKYVTGGGARG
ncbi:hypothetical protein ACHAXR_008881 [Thalassiosira sp. AJA248-18]